MSRTAETGRTSRQADWPAHWKRPAKLQAFYFARCLSAPVRGALRVVLMHAVMSMPASLVLHAIAMHMAVITRRRPLRPGLRARTHRWLSAAQFLCTAFDFGDPCRIGAFTDAALRRLRKCGGSSEQQRQCCNRNRAYFHDALSLMMGGQLSAESWKWFQMTEPHRCFRQCCTVWHNAASFQEAWPSG